MKPGDLQRLLQQYDIDPVHARGQNFLLDDQALDRMVEAAGVQAGERVLEIGPGPGVLTEKLLAAGARVTAVEIDGRLQKLLAERFDESLNLLRGDILEFSNEELKREIFGEVPAFAGTTGVNAGATGWKVVANIPYAITSKILIKFLEGTSKPTSLTLMVQLEVADRLTAKPGDMSQIAVLAQTYAEVSKVVKVPRGSFLPPPKVDSAIVHLALRDEAAITAFFEGIDRKRYFALVAAGFLQKRKKLRNTLPYPAEEADRLIAAAGLPAGCRPEDLSVEDWRKLAQAASATP
jgi:16S rRNA (adenine1518-N6/adenine1519-N6)-dimethyltransferase